MHFPKRLFLIAVACALVCAAGPAFAQKSSKSKAKEAAPPDDKAMMEAMMKAATPGEQHKMLVAMAGTWHTKTKMWTAPNQPPTESQGESTITVVLGGRFIQESAKSEMMGMPFEGTGLTGYDNIQKKFVGTWADSFGTMIMMMTGTWDAATKSITWIGKYPDPLTGKTKTMKMTTKEIDANNHVSEFWDEVSPGKFAKIMELTYTR
jgi:hypothetical protein